jgi:hypothetical protein
MLSFVLALQINYGAKNKKPLRLFRPVHVGGLLFGRRLGCKALDVGANLIGSLIVRGVADSTLAAACSLGRSADKLFRSVI